MATDYRDDLFKVDIPKGDGKVEKRIAGSFRGVPFFVPSHEFTSGRRKVDHEFPQREQSRSEDLGRKIRTFSLSMLVIGDDYVAQRNALMDALEREGAGELIHPYLGNKRVQVGGFSLTETIGSGRMATFEVSFSEAGQSRFPDVVVDAKESTKNAADATILEGESSFLDIFNVLNVPAFVLDASTDALDASLTFLTDSVTKFTTPIANLTFAVSNFKASLTALSKAPATLTARMKSTWELLAAELADVPETLEKVNGNFKNFKLDNVIGTTPSKNRQRANQDAIENFSKQLSYANEAKAAVDITYTNVDAALLVRDGVVDELDKQLNEDISDDLFQSIKDLQANITRALPPTNIGDLVEVTLSKTLPAIVIAHNLFQDLDREQEILDQNNVSHPGFVPGGTVLEVASGQ